MKTCDQDNIKYYIYIKYKPMLVIIVVSVEISISNRTLRLVGGDIVNQYNYDIVQYLLLRSSTGGLMLDIDRGGGSILDRLLSTMSDLGIVSRWVMGLR